MAEENIFFLPVSQFCRRVYYTCEVDEPVVELAATMAEKNVSSLVVRAGGDPVGIITDRDLRNKVVAIGADPRALRARQIMNGPLITVSEQDSFFEVVYQMSRHGIHRVGVVDEQGRLCGMVVESDLIKLQTKSPQHLVKEFENAASIAELKAHYREIEELVVFLHNAGVRTPDLVRLISDLHDQLLLRLVELLREERFPELTERFAFVVLGSEGRGEQTLKTDQDNAIIHAEDLGAAELERLEAFSAALIAALIEIGIPECPGGIMAKNPFWRRSLGEWTRAIDQWIGNPVSQNILNFSMVADVRLIYGDPGLVAELKEHILGRSAGNTLFMARMAANVARFNPPLGIFGGFRVEKEGEHKGQIDLKKAGIFVITEGMKVLALEAGLLGGSTREKIGRLRDKGVLGPKQAEDLEASFTLLAFFRLRGQVKAIAEGGEPDNFIDPESLNRVEEARFHEALEVVKSFQGTLKGHFRLNMLAG
ncbi:hypothetical protein DESUT3_00480 [Desulfuromonas versatilis]|uniref:CBS domain-containing protein n=1 Tax=Desulfuromonas versatilis TaxID=2802975 RepID=A0ABM8HNF2_9BACT|nr:putative nucleotidyltransferase substrate binding domain-containing protein [Desulfuromonas versatilis]BCR02979.1 hypothetical protein DESUT3_00480 [Desulfuromonas versatilis]